MIVLGKYVFTCPPKYQAPNRQDYGYYTNVKAVEDYWRADLDGAYNPRHVPTLIGEVIIDWCVVDVITPQQPDGNFYVLYTQSIFEDFEANTSWRRLFPDGRHIFYEGDDHEAFCKEIKEKFGFDPSESDTWSEYFGWSFHCPPEHLDAIYGSDQYPMGS